jgi:hypothetical protein
VVAVEPGAALAGCDDPVGLEDGAAADVAPVLLDGDLGTILQSSISAGMWCRFYQT